MNITSRIERIERQAREDDACPTCGGEGPVGIAIVNAAGEGPHAEPCATCGRPPTTPSMTIVDDLP